MLSSRNKHKQTMQKNYQENQQYSLEGINILIPLDNAKYECYNTLNWTHLKFKCVQSVFQLSLA